MIELYTAGTPNGHKVSILLEEVGINYTVKKIDLAAGEQKTKEFTQMNPNGKIPVIVDYLPSTGSEPITVFESGAILIYLSEKYGEFLPKHPNSRLCALQWLMFQVGGVGPMMGQSNVFRHYAPIKIQYAINRYEKETRRLLEVLDRGLTNTDYLAGEYSIADIANFAWARIYEWSGVNIEGLDNLRAWLQRVESRPAVKQGTRIPSEALGGTLLDNKNETIANAKEFLV